MKFLIKAKLETSDHDGYCSGDECEYSSSIVEYIIDDKEIIKLLPIPDINYGSGYCDNSKESQDHNLDIHDYRYTLLSIFSLQPLKKIRARAETRTKTRTKEGTREVRSAKRRSKVNSRTK